MQQGTETAPNPDELTVSVALATLQLGVTAPTGTELNVQLPFGRLGISNFESDMPNTGLGDLELRVKQNLTFKNRFNLQLATGLVVPTGEYLPASGAANLPPEASFLTLGRGALWWLADVQLSTALTSRFSVFSQGSFRAPLERTEDEFDWGNEARGVIGTQAKIIDQFSGLLILEAQWRGKASEPAGFGEGRVESSNAGGWWWTLTPGLSYKVKNNINLLAGVRIPVHTDVVGNQLAPGLGGFLSASWTQSLSKAKTPESPENNFKKPELVPGKINVVDYWATWCAPCKKIDGLLSSKEEEWPDVHVIRVDSSAWPAPGVEIPQEAKGLPAIEIFDKNGVRTDLLLGEQALEVIGVVEKRRQTP